MYKYLFYIIVTFVLIPSWIYAFDDKDTHPLLTEMAAENSKEFKNALKLLGFKNLEEKLINGENTWSITEWLQNGSEEEDEPACRAANHFHNPLKSWNQSMLTDGISFLDNLCDETTPFSEKYSNISWATGLKDKEGAPMSLMVNGPSSQPDENARNWIVARNHYYNALIETNKKEKEKEFAETFRTLGYVLHLLEDMAVPAHTRNDFSQGHIRIIGCPVGKLFCGKGWVGNRFEGYVRDYYKDEIHPLIIGEISKPFTDEKTLTNFWDTDTHVTGTTPVNFTGQDLGLAEYTNVNFVSYATIFKEESDTIHHFPYPNKDSIADQNYPDQIDEQLYNVMARDKKLDKGVYIGKKKHGEEIKKFLKPRYLFHGTGEFDPSYDLKYTLDHQCFLEYATHLIPRAIGYSATLLDYFFRGSIDISLSTEQHHGGIYAITTEPDQGFNRITLQAQNTSPDNNDLMTNGTIELVVKYKLALEDPFQSSSYPLTISDDFIYIVVPEVNDTHAIPKVTNENPDPVKLEFDLSQNPIPIWATDVSISVVYRGILGTEADAVVVGTKDISEPTPINLFSNLDKYCISGGANETNIYDAGSPEAIALADTNGNGEIDPYTERDVYPHNLQNVYFRISSVDDPQKPSCTEDDVYISEELTPGGFIRAAFFLSDYEYTISSCEIAPLIHPHPDDPRTDGWLEPYIRTEPAIKNQTDLADPAYCIANGFQPPCYIQSYPTFYSIRGVELFNGTIYVDSKPLWGWDDGSTCSFYDLQ